VSQKFDKIEEMWLRNLLSFLDETVRPAAQAQEAQRRPQLGRNVRNQRNRVVANQAAVPAHVQDDDDQDDEKAHPETDEKMGAKKRAKLEAKAEKKARREAEEKAREDQKKKDALADEERQKLEEKEKEEEKKREEAEKRAQEEKEKREYEEYLKMKQAFNVEEEGFEEDEDDKENLLKSFIDYIKTNKVVVIEDLASHFKLKTQAAIDRIVDLQKDGKISGVIDDRGKFIYVSEDELKAVVKFIKQRGRVSIADLAEHSNSLINLSGSA
jgi:hypothetical protein